MFSPDELSRVSVVDSLTCPDALSLLVELLRVSNGKGSRLDNRRDSLKEVQIEESAEKPFALDFTGKLQCVTIRRSVLGAGLSGVRQRHLTRTEVKIRHVYVFE